MDAMVANPEAGKTLNAVEGTDGLSGEKAMDGLRKGEATGGRQPAPTSVININR